MNSIFACWTFAYLIYGDPVVCLFSVFASRKYILFGYCSVSTDLLRIELSGTKFRLLKNDLSQNNCLVFVVALFLH